MKLDKDKLKTVLEISNVIIAYLETAEYIENDTVKICLTEKWWVEEVFFAVLVERWWLDVSLMFLMDVL